MIKFSLTTSYLLFAALSVMKIFPADIWGEKNSNCCYYEETAVWESESDSEIYGEKVLAEFYNCKSNCFRLNAFASATTFSTIAGIKKKNLNILGNLNTNGNEGDALLSARILSKISEISVSPMKRKESRIIKNIPFISQCRRVANPAALITTLPPSRSIRHYLQTGICSLSPTVKIDKSEDSPGRRLPDICRKFPGLIDISEKSNRDLYRQFLYIRDITANRERGYVQINSLLPPLILYNVKTRNSYRKTICRITSPEGAAL